MKLLSSIKIATIATAAITFWGLPKLVQSQTFSDVSEETLYQNYISQAADRKIVEGFPDGTFRPDEKVTREQAAVMIVKAIGTVTAVDLDARPTNRTVRPFQDLPEDRWSAKEINWIQWNLFPANTTVLTGNFRPQDNITRVELVDFLRRTGEFLGSKLDGNPDLPQPQEPMAFSDVSGYDKVLTMQMSAFCRVAAPLNEAGTAFGPQKAADRAYTAAAIIRALDCE